MVPFGEGLVVDTGYVLVVYSDIGGSSKSKRREEEEEEKGEHAVEHVQFGVLKTVQPVSYPKSWCIDCQ